MSRRLLTYAKRLLMVIGALVVLSVILGFAGVALVTSHRSTGGAPTTSEVQSDMRAARGPRHLAISHAACRELEHFHWRCTVTLKDGQVETDGVTWYASSRTLGINKLSR